MLTFYVVTIMWLYIFIVFKKNVIEDFKSVLLKQRHNDENINDVIHYYIILIITLLQRHNE